MDHKEEQIQKMIKENWVQEIKGIMDSHDDEVQNIIKLGMMRILDKHKEEIQAYYKSNP
tara:strand:+ start:380 stop:556 length:177 start_codon:yes stop_codon:yes gene_type:complete